MTDIDPFQIVERPLVIHEALTKGRRLTKALFMQLPDLDSMPVASTGIRIVCWVNLHWKDCASGRYDYEDDVGYEHRHVLVEENGQPKRATAWDAKHSQAPVSLFLGDAPAGEAMAALLARLKLTNKLWSHGRGQITAKWYEQTINFTYGGRAEILDSYLSTAQVANGEPPAQLVALAMPSEDEDQLRAKIRSFMEGVVSWRNDLAQLWDLVTKETPQVFL